MSEVEVEVSLIDIKNLYEYFFEIYRKEGLSVSWSLLTYKNLQYLVTPYNQIREGVYDETKDPKFLEYSEKMNKLIQKYVDRDEQGNPIFENEEPRITEMIVEFNKANDEVEKEYKELLEKLDSKNEINGKFLSQKVKIKLWKMPANDIPDKVPPYVVGLIAE